MTRRQKYVFAGALPVLIAGFFIFTGFVEPDQKKDYIIDQTGKRWDVNQAETLGFRPEKFQYGIGMNAFTTLDDSHIFDNGKTADKNNRVIGISRGDESHAYSVNRLRYHEIANTNIDGAAIAAGY